MSLSGETEREKVVAVNETKVMQAWLQEMVWEERPNCEDCGPVLNFPPDVLGDEPNLPVMGSTGMLVVAKDTLSCSCWSCVAAVSLIELDIGD